MNKIKLLFLIFTNMFFQATFGQTKEDLYWVGSGKSDITYSVDNLSFFGYGDYEQRVIDGKNGFTSRIYSRVISIKNPTSGKQIIYLHADLGAIFGDIRNGLIKQIKEKLYPDFDEASLIMTASHTHCAPSGISQYPLYMMSSPGYNPELVTFLISQMYESVFQSVQNQKLSRIQFKEGTFAPEIPVAYNRALKPHNANPEITKKYKRQETNLALNRTMSMLCFTDSNDKHQSLLNWFGVHPIEVLPDHHFINGASKGYAALYAEEKLPDGAVAIFAQSAAGDVMTSDGHNPQAFDLLMQKKLADSTYNFHITSLKQAQWNGKIQADKAIEIQQSLKTVEVFGDIDYELIYVDMSNIEVESEYAHKNKNARTSSACLGAPFFSGSFIWRDNSIKRRILSFISSIGTSCMKANSIWLPKKERLALKAFNKSQSPKKIVINGETKTIFGVKLAQYKKKKFATFFLNQMGKQDLVLKESIRQLDLGALKEHTLLPQILPIQIVRIGNIAIAGIPTEITTIAYQRLENTLLDVLKKDGIEKVLISSYANEYAGYTTTYEEYKRQRYEGGHTLFGKHQLGAFQTEFKKLALELLKPKAERILNRDIKPPVFSNKELEMRSHLLPLKLH